MKVVAISDLHGYLPTIPECDILLIAGDICAHGPTQFQLAWLDGPFREWLDGIKVPVFACAGNHDWPFYNYKDMIPEGLKWTYLEDESVEHEGWKIWGTPWQKRFFDWAFNLDEEELEEKWNLIPDDTDIIIAHSPPKFFGDLTPGTMGENVGSPSLLKRIVAIKPKLVVFGHIHNGRGDWVHNDTILANVTVLNESYKMVYDPWVVELEK